tara:strand:+ start:28470 stop:28673 length:204 start_codon:yes stop_codon:yes gene_type:complete
LNNVQAESATQTAEHRSLAKDFHVNRAETTARFQQVTPMLPSEVFKAMLSSHHPSAVTDAFLQVGDN